MSLQNNFLDKTAIALRMLSRLYWDKTSERD